MAHNYINGYDYPTFKIYLNDILIDTINLHRTDESGLVVKPEFYFINHELIDHTNLQTREGFHLNFSLSYNTYSSKENTIKIFRLLNYFLNNIYKIEITPRSDITTIKYEVILNMDSMEIGILTGGAKAQGHQLINLDFKTKYLQNQFNWIDPDQIQYIGTYLPQTVGIKAVA